MGSGSIQKLRINQFRDALTEGINGIVRASEIYVDAIDDDPRCVDEFRREFAEWVPASAWSNFEAVGRKWMHPKMIMGGMANRKKAAFVKRLPYSMQERVFNRERFELLVGQGDVMQVNMMEATERQVEQLCDGSSIRNIAEQKAWLECRKLEQEEKTEPMPYTIGAGKVSFRRGVTMTRAELKRLLQEM